MNNQKLAELIYGIGQYDGYNTSILQTEKNLEKHPENRVFASESDRYIFEDLLKAINYAKGLSNLTSQDVLAINAQMDSKQPGQPEAPGVLRDHLPIHVGDYVPPETVTLPMLDRQLQAVQGQTPQSGWELYARLAKLQAFDNGNKRTALVASNVLVGSLSGKTSLYLTVPIDYRKLRFDANLMDYYLADDWDDHLPDEDFALQQFIEFASQLTESVS
ncbi:MAG: Fic family protein [Streptococcaceae bacterium]|jgi:hypothetical protein|nr:Fic family protein [Streptococcaceae bacterium]